MNRIVAVVLMCVVIAGCTPPSLNLQRSAARDIGDTAITVYLDETEETAVNNNKEIILNIANEIEKFIDDGKVGELTVGALRDFVNKTVPVDYANIAEAVVQQVGKIEAPTDKIPEQAIKNIKALLMGIKTGVNEYKIEDRSKSSEVK